MSWRLFNGACWSYFRIFARSEGLQKWYERKSLQGIISIQADLKRPIYSKLKQFFIYHNIHSTHKSHHPKSHLPYRVQCDIPRRSRVTPRAHAPLLCFSSSHASMDSSIVAPLSVTPSASSSADLHSPLSSLEIAFGPGTTLGPFLGVLFAVVVGLALLFLATWGAMQWWQVFITHKY